MLVRRERPGDAPCVRAVVAAAFAGDDGAEPIEVGLLDRLRDDGGWLPAFSLVAGEVVGEVVGHVVATRGHVGEQPALGVGPVAVPPDHQRRGVGSALMHGVLAAAEAREESLVALLGEPAFYGRFGFRPAAEHGVEAPDAAWGRFFQVRALAGDPPRGRFRYAAPFVEL
ncbi:N-acetyltransferase [Actinomycetospora sp. NBRC 106375]|uniref:GNAT family N-acetyltransferase n=1 Tax=Actinomycetospora sp. NBRC 106375 TaxID=3032207 RepID=UPI0024A1E4A3|nr:N-acetyltransferase [Actinomycetospora sp. NBRC 106375]GLZ45987.1 N-acetyltransferase [Actinomycetospora sp. NBRC 106375]